jgi:hypothetical protein
MAYGSFSDGWRLLSTRNISNSYVLPLFFNSGWRLEDCRLNEDSLGSEGILEFGATYPRPALSVGLF